MLKKTIFFIFLLSAGVVVACPTDLAAEDPAFNIPVQAVIDRGYTCSAPKYASIPQMPHTYDYPIQLACLKKLESGESHISIIARHQIHSTLLCQITVLIKETFRPVGS